MIPLHFIVYFVRLVIKCIMYKQLPETGK